MQSWAVSSSPFGRAGADTCAKFVTQNSPLLLLMESATFAKISTVRPSPAMRLSRVNASVSEFASYEPGPETELKNSGSTSLTVTGLKVSPLVFLIASLNNTWLPGENVASVEARISTNRPETGFLTSLLIVRSVGGQETVPPYSPTQVCAETFFTTKSKERAKRDRTMFFFIVSYVTI